MKTLPVAVQVYSVRDDAERDFKGTMQKIKDMGYDGVELAGLYGMKPAEVKAILEEVGLVPLSAHVPFQELEAEVVDAVGEAVLQCAQQQVVRGDDAVGLQTHQLLDEGERTPLFVGRVGALQNFVENNK